MKKKIVLTTLYTAFLIVVTIYMSKLPFYFWSFLEIFAIDTYGIGAFAGTLLLVGLLVFATIFGGYILLKNLLKDSVEHKKFWGIFLFCCIISIGLFNVWSADIQGIYYKTNKSVEVFAEADSGTPIIVSRDILEEHVDADFKSGDYLEFLPGSSLHSKLGIDEDIKLYLKTDYCRSYSYTIG